MPPLPRSSALRTGYLALAALDTWLSGCHAGAADRARRVTKPLLVPTLAASLVTDERARRSPLLASTLGGLAGGWVGDAALLGESKAAFLSGLSAFAVGHAAYIGGFLRHRSSRPMSHTRTTRLVGAATVASAPLLAYAAERRQPGVGLPVLGYAGLLGLMVATAGHLDERLPARTRRLTLAGAAVFLVSDATLAIREFVLAQPTAAWERTVMATYTAAQLLLVEGVRSAGC